MELGTALALGGVALAGPGVVITLSTIAKKISVAADYHIHINDEAETCHRLLVYCKGETHELLQWCSTIWNALSPEIQDQIQALQDELHGIYVNIVRAFPPSSIAGEGKDKGKKIVSRTLSPGNVKKIKNEISNLEKWNFRFHLRAVEILWFSHIRAPDSTKRAQLIRSFETIDRVDRIRNAVKDSLEERPPPLTRLLLDDATVSGHLQRLHTDRRDASLFRLESPSGDTVLVEWREYSDDAPSEKVERLRKVVRDVASILHHAQPQTMGILQCRGFTSIPTKNRFELHFNTPKHLSGQNIQSLRNLLKTSRSINVSHSLTQRLAVAKNIAAAVYYVHASDFVHKNIRPDNIIVFDPSCPAHVHETQAKYYRFPRVLGEAYLVGYDGTRKADAGSSRTATEESNKVLYLDPERAESEISVDFSMKHDVYSLGVVLLELGLWTDFTNPQANYSKMLWSGEREEMRLKSPQDRHQQLVELARKFLPPLLGEKYTSAVIACLTRLRDEEQAGILRDADNVEIGEAYITQVLTRLEEIVV